MRRIRFCNKFNSNNHLGEGVLWKPSCDGNQRVGIATDVFKRRFVLLIIKRHSPSQQTSTHKTTSTQQKKNDEVLFGGKKKVLLLLLLSGFFPKQESLVETSRCLPVWESSLWKTGLSGNGICHRAAMWVAKWHLVALRHWVSPLRGSDVIFLCRFKSFQTGRYVCPFAARWSIFRTPENKRCQSLASFSLLYSVAQNKHRRRKEETQGKKKNKKKNKKKKKKKKGLFVGTVRRQQTKTKKQQKKNQSVHAAWCPVFFVLDPLFLFLCFLPFCFVVRAVVALVVLFAPPSSSSC